jgi:iron complex transport system ATP-binding protein
MSDLAVDVRSLGVRRGGRTVLQVDQLAVRNGEVVAVLGSNGAGKTTLLKCLLGFVRPTAGEICVLHQTVAPWSTVSLCRLRRRIGYLPQLPGAAGETPLTVREVAAIGRTGIVGLGHCLTRADWAVIDLWLGRLGLAELTDRAYASLSGGEQRKVLIAKAMVQQPEILLLDEPTANLDLFWREQIVETLERLHTETGLTIILVCHELEAIPACCQRVLMLRQGRVTADGLPTDVLTPQRIELLYGTRLRLLPLGNRYAIVPIAEAVL